MARCELSGKSPVVKNLVSHSNIKTKSRAYINIQKRRLFSQSLKQMCTFKIAIGVLRSLEHQGGLDVFLIHQDNQFLSKKALKVKTRILNALGAKSKKQKARSTSNANEA